MTQKAQAVRLGRAHQRQQGPACTAGFASRLPGYRISAASIRRACCLDRVLSGADPIRPSCLPWRKPTLPHPGLRGGGR